MPHQKHLPLILVAIAFAAMQFLPDQYGRWIYENGIVHLIFALSGIFYGFQGFRSWQRKERYALLVMGFSALLLLFGLANFAGFIRLEFMHAMLGYIFIIAGIFLL